MTLPTIIFNDNTDYDEVLNSTKIYFGELIDSKGCGCDDKLDNSFCKTLGYIYAADYQASKEIPELIKYQKAVKAAYLSLSCIKC